MFRCFFPRSVERPGFHDGDAVPLGALDLKAAENASGGWPSWKANKKKQQTQLHDFPFLLLDY